MPLLQRESYEFKAERRNFVTYVRLTQTIMRVQAN